MNHIPEILLLLFVINLGTVFGAGIYEMRIVMPLWFSKLPDGSYSANTEAMRTIDSGRKFWGMVTTVPLTLLTIANIVVAIQSQPPKHDWWLAASLVTLVDRIGTFSFFIPTFLKLLKADSLPATKVSGLVSLWINMNYIRNLITLIAWLLALKAVML